MPWQKEFHDWIESHLPELVYEPRGHMRHTYISLGSHYGERGRTFFWDAFFSALRFYHSGLDGPVQGTLDCYLDHMRTGGPDDGQVFRILTPDGPCVLADAEQIQPFLCQLAYLANKMSPLKDRAASILDRLAAYLGFWRRRRGTQWGLYRWLDVYESGIDSNLAVSCFPPFTIIGVDLNSYLVLEYRAIAALADEYGRADQAREYRKRADELAENVRKYLWDPQRRLFCNLDTATGKLVYRAFDGDDACDDDVCFLPWTNFTPLYAGIATKVQAAATIERYLLNYEEMRCRFGFRSLSRRSVYYTEQRVCPPANLAMFPLLKSGSNWSGAVWTLSNYMLAHGLRHYGFVEDAVKIARETAELNWRSIQNEGGMFENYHPKTGKGLWATGLFSWNILADVLEEEIVNHTGALRDLTPVRV